MPSFFLSETLKYVYLLFDEDNWVFGDDNYIFTTEGHPIPSRTHLRTSAHACTSAHKNKPWPGLPQSCPRARPGPAWLPENWHDQNPDLTVSHHDHWHLMRH